MSDGSKIEWTEASWNPVTGCTEVSPGCDNCYAKTFAERFRGVPGHHFERGFDVVLRPERLDQPIRWKRPRRIFVNSMSDLFHDAVPDEFVARVFAVMAATPRHTYQLLTKRHGRMRSLLTNERFAELVAWNLDLLTDGALYEFAAPAPNVWLGVSVEDQKWADIRIPALLETPAAVRWLSCEPLLGPVRLWDSLACDHTRHSCAGVGCWRAIDWVVVGGESGRGARPMHPDWARSLRDQCAVAGVPFFLKQLGQYAPVADRPRAGDLWLAPDGGTTDWEHGDGYIRQAGGEYRWPGARSVLVRRASSKAAAGRELDGRTWDEYPQAVARV